MKNTPKEKDKTRALINLLKRINRGADPRLLRKEANRMLPTVQPADIASAEQKLIENGYSAQLAEQLATAFVIMGVLEEQPCNLRAQLPKGHVLRKILAEHELVQCFLADLERVTNMIQNCDELSDTSLEFQRLAHIVEHLDAMDEHIEREEDVIFPYLQKYNWSGMCRAAKSDHVYIKVAVNDLIRLLGAFNNINLKEFKTKLNAITTYLCPAASEHIFQEECILYPLAIQAIKENGVWEKIKTVCDQIGYCGVHI